MSVNFDIRESQVSSQVPICAICTGDEPRIQMVKDKKGVRHWPREEHVTQKSDTPTKNVSPQDKKCVTCERVITGRGNVCHACRQAAYRRRHEA